MSRQANPAQGDVPEESRMLPDESTQPVPDGLTLLDTPASSCKAAMVLVGINVVVFVLMVVSTGLGSFWLPTSDTLIKWGANFGALTAGGQYWRLLTCMWIHVGVLHLGLNMYFLWMAGQTVERFYGSTKLIVIYLVAGMAGALSTIFFDPVLISAGASGAIYGLVGAILSFLLGQHKHFPARQLRIQLTVMSLFVAYSLFFSYISPEVDDAAHVGGLLAGFLCGVCLLPASPGNRRWLVSNLVSVSALVVALAVAAAAAGTTIVNDSRVTAFHFAKNAMASLKREDFTQALYEFDELVKLDPGRASAHSGRALALIGLERYADAIASSDRAIALDPRESSGYLARATAYHYLSDEARAIADLDYVIRLSPRNAQAYNSRAWNYIIVGRCQDALVDATKALSLNPRMVIALDTRGVAYLCLGQTDKAIQDFSSGLAINPNEGACYFHRAQAYQKLGDARLADNDLEAAARLKFTPEDWERRPATD